MTFQEFTQKTGRLFVRTPGKPGQLIQIDLRDFPDVPNPMRSIMDPAQAGTFNGKGTKTRNRKQAASWLQDWWEWAEGHRNGQSQGTKLTQELVDEYVAERISSPSTLAASRRAASNVLADSEGRTLGSVQILDTLQRLRTEPNERGTGPRSGKYLSTTFDQLRTFAKWLNQRHGAGITIPERPSWLNGANRTAPREGYAPEQAEQALAQADTEGVGHIVRLCLATGVRIMEAFALRWEDIEMVDGMMLVHVTGQVYRTDMDTVVPSKSGVGKDRWTIVGGYGAELALGVMEGRTGFILGRDEIKTAPKAYNRALRAAGLKRPRELFHMLRHTFARDQLEVLLANGMDAYGIVSVWLGHAGPHITRQHYPGLGARAQSLAGLQALAGVGSVAKAVAPKEGNGVNAGV